MNAHGHLVRREELTREDISVQRDWFRFLIETCELDWDLYDAAAITNLHTFVYGSTEESTAAFFWMIGCEIYCSKKEPMFDLDIVALGDDISYLLRYEHLHDTTIISQLAVNYVRNASVDASHSAKNRRTLGELVAGAIDLGHDLHGSTDDVSPLLRVLHGNGAVLSAEDMRTRLDAWLALLSSIGVDLRLYGQEEWRRFQVLRRDCERPWDRWHGTDAHQCEDYLDDGTIADLEFAPTLTAFTYGENISDWKLWLLHPGDQCAGQFWRLIEQNGIWGRHVPGGWVEDD